MDTLNSPSDDFDFNNVKLTTPISLNNGNHFIKYYLRDSPLYIQPPKCTVKQGIVKATKKLYFDLMFTAENDEFIRWLENLEQYSRNFIFDNREKWFETELDENDIENSFTSPLKTYKSGKFYILRVTIPTHLGKTNLKIYDEQENVLDLEHIAENDNVITALEVLGIKCSPRSFQIEIELKQLLKLKKNNIFENCILGTQIKNNLEAKKNDENVTDVINDDVNDDVNDNVNDDVLPLIESNINDIQNNIEQTDSNNEINDEVSEINDNIINDLEIDNTENLDEDITEENIIVEDTNNIQTNDDELKEVDINLEENDLDHDKNDLDQNENDSNSPLEVDIPLEKINTDAISLKKRDEIYYELYRDALNKAKEAKDLALSRFLEAKEIKNRYMLDDIESDLEEESIELIE